MKKCEIVKQKHEVFLVRILKKKRYSFFVCWSKGDTDSFVTRCGKGLCLGDMDYLSFSGGNSKKDALIEFNEIVFDLENDKPPCFYYERN